MLTYQVAIFFTPDGDDRVYSDEYLTCADSIGAAVAKALAYFNKTHEDIGPIRVDSRLVVGEWLP